MRRVGPLVALRVALAGLAHAAPDEDKLGQTGANATAEAGQTSLGVERDEFWRGVVRYYGQW